jgi:chromosome partitioning protein
MKKIIVLNPKGGSGKTTLATNLAAWYAAEGHHVALMDFDPQGSSARWIAARPDACPAIDIVKAFERNTRTTRAFQLHTSPDAAYVIVDTPAGTGRDVLENLARDAHAVVIPVLPSEIDIHAASRCIGDLLLCAKIKPRDGRIGVVANRVKKNTKVYRALLRFLRQLEIPFITSLRDAQVYVHAAGEGKGICELPRHRVRADLETWGPLINWLEADRDTCSPPVRNATGQGADVVAPA